LQGSKPLTISGSDLNNTGTVTNTNTAVTTISANIGAAVTSVTQNSTNTMFVSGTNSFAGVITLNQRGGTLSVATIGDGGVSSNLGADGVAAANLVFPAAKRPPSFDTPASPLVPIAAFSLAMTQQP